MYQTVSQSWARPELGLSTYTLDKVTYMLQRTTSIINSYLNQSIELNSVDETVKVRATVRSDGGIHIQLPRRFITEVTSIILEFGYNITDITIDVDSELFISREEGFLQVSPQVCPQIYFNDPYSYDVYAEVKYKAGFTVAEINDKNDFVEAFYEILKKVKDGLDADNSLGVKSVSNKIKEYKTMNEQIKYAEDNISLNSTDFLDDWVKQQLNPYKISNLGISKGGSR